MKTIRILIAAGMVLLPSMATAVTKCWINEFVDHREAVCIGNEKPLPESRYASPQATQWAPAQNQASSQTSAGTTTISSPLRAGSPQWATVGQLQNQQPVTTQPQTPATPQSIETMAAAPPSQTGAPQTTVVHRQGRQQYQQALEEARAARLQLISQLRQMQQNQAH